MNSKYKEVAKLEVYMEREEYEALRRAADRAYISMSAAVRKLICKQLNIAPKARGDREDG